MAFNHNLINKTSQVVVIVKSGAATSTWALRHAPTIQVRRYRLISQNWYYDQIKNCVLDSRQRLSNLIRQCVVNSCSFNYKSDYSRCTPSIVTRYGQIRSDRACMIGTDEKRWIIPRACVTWRNYACDTMSIICIFIVASRPFIFKRS